MGKLFGTDGMRGLANTYPITAEVALKTGKAIAAVLNRDGRGNRLRAIIGKDTRLSGYMLETALTSGLVSMGMDVLLVGPVPTPAVAHLTRSMLCSVGIMLTASHNPYDDNGIKIFDRNGFKLSDALEAQIEAAVLGTELDSSHIRSADIGKAYRVDDARGRYIEYAKNTIGNQDLHGMKLVLDCANGAAYQIGPWVFRELGAEVTKLGVEPDGLNINTGCGALHPQNLAAAVRDQKADAGIALDGDADRVVFCDAAGNVVDGDRIMAICAAELQAAGRLSNNTLVVTTMSNLGLHEAMRTRGIRVETTDVGDRHVIDRLRAGGHSLGGEKSGHFIFMDHATTGDGIISALQVLKLMKRQGAGLRELANCMTEYPQRLVSLPVAARRPLADLPGLSAAITACEAELAGRGRVIVRYSGTEPLIRILVEADNGDAVERWIEKLGQAVKKELGS